MKPTKYRGQDIKTEEWRYGYFVQCRGHSYILPLYDDDNPKHGFDERWICEGADDDGWFEVHPDTVGQYTDRKDKNGVENFAGDKIIDDDFKGIKIIKWSTLTCGFIAVGETGFYHHLSSMGSFEVISTIHDKEKP